MSDGYNGISNLIGHFITMFIGMLKGSMISNNIVDITSGLSPSTNALLMVLLAPFAEGILSRKLLIVRTLKYGEGIAIFFSGLMFGLFHGNLKQFAYALTIGIFLEFVYLKT